jgi:hypothetical protein
VFVALLGLSSCAQAPEGAVPDPDTSRAPEVSETAETMAPTWIAIVPRVLNFSMTCRPSVEASVTLRACGSEPVAVTSIHLSEDSSPAYSLDFEGLTSGEPPTPQTPLVLTASQEAAFGVVFKPARFGSAKGTILVASDSSEPVLEVPIVVFSVEPFCPLPRIELAGPEPIVMGTELKLAGGASCSLNGPVGSYRWTVSGPDGNPAEPKLLSTGQDTEDEPQVAGTWTYCLDVCDGDFCSQDAQCATTACVQVIVTDSNAN